MMKAHPDSVHVAAQHLISVTARMRFRGGRHPRPCQHAGVQWGGDANGVSCCPRLCSAPAAGYSGLKCSVWNTNTRRPGCPSCSRVIVKGANAPALASRLFPPPSPPEKPPFLNWAVWGGVQETLQDNCSVPLREKRGWLSRPRLAHTTTLFLGLRPEYRGLL